MTFDLDLDMTLSVYLYFVNFGNVSLKWENNTTSEVLLPVNLLETKFLVVLQLVKLFGLFGNSRVLLVNIINLMSKFKLNSVGP